MFKNSLSFAENGKGLPDLGLVVSFILPIFFLAWNLFHYSGPAYLNDEIGYLSKAALLGGYAVDKATGYHAGYSLFLAPLFLIFKSPWVIWKGVMVINSAFWIGSFLILRRLLLRWFPGLPLRVRDLALLVAAIYPGWFAISGYAFPSSAFVFFFMLCVSSLFSWKGANVRSLLPHSFLVGFLYWVHPTAIGVGLASFCVVFLESKRSRKYLAFFVHLAITIGFFYLYHKIIGPLINDAMTPSGYKIYWEYPQIKNLIIGVFHRRVFVSFIARMFGEFSYLAIGSLGLALFGVLFCMRKSAMKGPFSVCHFGDVGTSEATPVVPIRFLFLPLAVGFIIAMGSMMFAVLSSSRADHWIYGRYLEGALLPLVACGLIELSEAKWKTRVILAVLTFLTLIVTGWVIDRLGASVIYNNQVNLAAFWPAYLFGKGGFLFWGLLGSLGIWGICILGWRASLVLMACSLMICSINQTHWHENILRSYSRPSSIVDIIKENFSPGSCVGFDDALPRYGSSTFHTLGESLGKYIPSKYKYNLSLYQLERYSLYSFYLYNYHYRRMVADEWRSGCDGPILTYAPDQYAGHKDEHIVARESMSGLFMVAKQANLKISSNLRQKKDVAYAENSSYPCLVNGCFSMDASQLSRYTEVGKLVGKNLVTTGKGGFLFFGPYRILRPGSYKLIMRGAWSIDDSAWIDIVADGGNNLIAKFDVNSRQMGPHEITRYFVLGASVQNLEVRFHVGANDRADISSYQIKLADEDAPN